jgi:nitrogen fixation NifU-like protein
VVGKPVEEAVAVQEEFLRLLQSKGTVEPDEEVLEDAVAFAGVSKYPSRVKCALLGWMAWKDATAQAVERDGTTSERESPQREGGATTAARPALAPAGLAEERAQ